MKIKIKDQELELAYSMRTYILFENIQGQSLSFENLNSYTSLIVLFYSAIVATIQKRKLDISLNYDEFIDWLDENNGENMIKEFSNWFTTQLTNNLALQDAEQEKETKGSKKSKK